MTTKHFPLWGGRLTPVEQRPGGLFGDPSVAEALGGGNFDVIRVFGDLGGDAGGRGGWTQGGHEDIDWIDIFIELHILSGLQPHGPARLSIPYLVVQMGFFALDWGRISWSIYFCRSERKNVTDSLLST